MATAALLGLEPVSLFGPARQDFTNLKPGAWNSVWPEPFLPPPPAPPPSPSLPPPPPTIRLLLSRHPLWREPRAKGQEPLAAAIWALSRRAGTGEERSQPATGESRGSFSRQLRVWKELRLRWRRRTKAHGSGFRGGDPRSPAQTHRDLTRP